MEYAAPAAAKDGAGALHVEDYFLDALAPRCFAGPADPPWARAAPAAAPRNAPVDEAPNLDDGANCVVLNPKTTR